MRQTILQSSRCEVSGPGQKAPNKPMYLLPVDPDRGTRIYNAEKNESRQQIRYLKPKMRTIRGTLIKIRTFTSLINKNKLKMV